MKLYIAVGGWGYEGFTILGVFDSEKLALERIEAEIERKYYSFDYTRVFEVYLNAGIEAQ